MLEKIKKFFDLKTPSSATIAEWREWKKQTKSQYPFRYWLLETLPSAIRLANHRYWEPLSTLRCWCKNRFITKSHLLRTGLAPGKYYETDERILHGCFNTLKEFVEQDKAYLNFWCNYKSHKWWQSRAPFSWFYTVPKSQGIEYLQWESTLKHNADCFLDPNEPVIGTPTPQALAAQEILDLYIWWTQTRPLRDQNSACVNYHNFCEEMHAKYQDSWFMDLPNPQESQKLRQLMDDYNTEEHRQHQEDEDMLIKLMRVRRSLWT